MVPRPISDGFCPSCGAPHGPDATYCASCGQRLLDAAPSAAEVTIAAKFGRSAALVLLGLGQVIGALLLLALEFTSDTELLSVSALVGFLACSVAAWMISRAHPLQALLLMLAGGAGLFALLMFADSQEWLGA